MKNALKSDLRGAVRFPLRLPLTVRGGLPQTGETINISAGGVLFRCAQDYAIGSAIEFTIQMPAQVLAAEQDVNLVCQGRVVRCQANGSAVEVGAIIDEYLISR